MILLSAAAMTDAAVVANEPRQNWMLAVGDKRRRFVDRSINRPSGSVAA